MKKQIKRFITFAMSSIRIASETQTLKFFQETYGSKHRNKRIYGLYSSDFNKIITDEHYMLIPIDQRMATRAHAVFDVIYVKKLQLINLDAHVNRLFNSSKTLSIQLEMNHEQVKLIIIQVMQSIIRKMKQEGETFSSLYNKVFGVRLTISSGYGDFGIVSLGKKPVFYMAVFEPYINYDLEKEGVRQFVVKQVQDTISDFVHVKTVNYIDNALMANKSKTLGGYQGIKAKKDGVLLQASMANIAFMFGKEFATPRFQTVIKGTTISKLLKYVNQLKDQGVIDKISFRDILVEQAEKNATEMLILGGDKIVPVLEFNGKKISERKGKFTEMFQNWYEKQNEVETPIFNKEDFDFE